MGLTKNMIQLVLSSQLKRNVSFAEMITIGRQNLHLNRGQLKDALNEFNFTIDDVTHVIEKYNGFSEGVFEHCGAKLVDSLDASNYENATVIHDLNTPISGKHEKEYDLVLDSGTLEHVFNFPVAIRNYMDLTKVGGHFIGIYPCNNFYGHGFYQFSSEVFYRTFSKDNGFKVIDAIIFVDEPNTTFYSVQDTDEIHQRVEFNNTKPAYIYVVARKIDKSIPFKNFPLQTDYSEFKWKGNRQAAKRNKSRKSIKKLIPPYLKNLAKALMNKKFKDSGNFNKPYFSTYKLR